MNKSGKFAITSFAGLVIGALLVILLNFFPSIFIYRFFSRDGLFLLLLASTISVHISLLIIAVGVRKNKSYKKGYEDARKECAEMKGFGRNFHEGFKYVIEKAMDGLPSKRLECIHIFARSGNMYVDSLNTFCRDKDFCLVQTFGEVKLLTAKGELLKENGYLETNVGSWNQLFSLSRFEKAFTDIRNEYDFIPAYHFAIINNKWLFYGLFPVDNLADEVDDVFVTSIDTDFGRSFLEMFSVMFDKLYNEN